MSRHWPRFLGVLALAALLASGCKRAEKTKTTTTGGGPTPASTATPASDNTAGVAGEKSAAKLPSPSSLPVESRPLAPDALKPTEPGRYIYDETGVRKMTGCGPDERPATPSSLQVDAAQGSRQQSVRDRRYASDGHGEVATNVLEFRADGVYLIRSRQDQTFFLGTYSTEFEPSPPVLVFPSDRSVGRTWSFTLKSKDGKLTVDSTSQVEAADEPVALGGGETVNALRMKGTSHVYGQISGSGPPLDADISETSTTWISIPARLIVKTITDASGTVATCRLDGTHIEAVSRSTKPS